MISSIIIYIIGVVLAFLIGNMTYKKIFKDSNIPYPKGAEHVLVILVSLTAYLGLIAWIVIYIMHTPFK